ncbi:MAG: type II toxin-antitoxin system HicB family antitoxin [Pseudomonadota bacterium]
MLFPAFVEVDKDKTASGWFPNIQGCIFAGDSLEEAYEDAKTAICAHLELLADKGLNLPCAQPVEFHMAASPDDYENGRWLYVDVNMDKFDGRTERINVTLPRRLIDKIDSLVSSDTRYPSRSAFLADAARKQMTKV